MKQYKLVLQESGECRYNPEVRKVTGSKASYKALLPLFMDELKVRELMYCLFLSRQNEIIGYDLISIGSAVGTVCNIQRIAQQALQRNAQGVILSHNHPSGNLNPSDGDNIMTKKVKDALGLFDIVLVDHIILGGCDGEYYSYADNFMLR